MVNTDLQFGQQRSPGASYSCIKHSSNKSRGGGGLKKGKFDFFPVSVEVGGASGEIFF